MDPLVIGVDVCKDRLDAAVSAVADAPAPPAKKQFTNDAGGIAELVAWAQPFHPHRIVFESTGHYQKHAVGALLTAGLPAVVVNARQVRDFAKGVGLLAKTDTIDASVLARFGQVVETTVRPLPTTEIQTFQDLYDRRGQLVKMLAIEKNHRHAAAAAAAKVRANIDAHIAYLEKQIDRLEEQLDRLVESSATFRARDEILRTIPGVGPQVSRTLLAHLPELGQGSRQTIAALVGLAPYNDDSGKSQHARHIRGGRGRVRIGLYQAAVVAIRYCPEMKDFYRRLKAKGKASKIALVAVARKLLVLANALIRTMKPYECRANSVCPETV